MRKVICVLAIMITIVAGCTGTSSRNGTTKSPDEVTVKNLDSLSEEAEKAKNDIEVSSKQVDSLMNKL